METTIKAGMGMENLNESGNVIATRIVDDDPKFIEIKPIVKKCKVCGKELPLYRFRLSRSGNHIDTCNKCVLDARMATRQENVEAQRKKEAMHDAMFDGKQPCEVLQIMGRAKKWLEARGYEIVLRGSLTVKKDVKFE